MLGHNSFSVKYIYLIMHNRGRLTRTFIRRTTLLSYFNDCISQLVYYLYYKIKVVNDAY